MPEETTETTPTEEAKPKTKKGRSFSSDSPSMADIIRKKRPNERTCAILLDSALANEIEELSSEIEMLERKRSAQSKASLSSTMSRDIEKKLDELDKLAEKAEDMSVTFTFRDIGRRRYDELVAEFPPSNAEKEEYKNAGGEGKLVYSINKFPPALVSKTAIKPEISITEAEDIFENWSEGDLELLFTTALLACKEPTSLPKFRAGIERMRDSRQNSTTAPDKESLTQSS